MNKSSISKVLGCALISTFIFIAIYLVIGASTNTDIITKYDEVKPTSSSGISKTLQFLMSYTRTTGDVTLAVNKGMSYEEAEEIVATGTLGSLTPEANQLTGSITYATNMTKESWEKALETRAGSEGDAGEYFALGAGFKVVEVNGSSYLVEVQGSGKWEKVSNRENGTVQSSGCYMFASSTAINALNMSTVSVADIMHEMFPDSNNYNYDKNSHLWTGRADDIGRPVDGKAQPVFSKYNLKYKTLYNSGMDGASLTEKINKYGFDDTVYIIYGHKSGLLSSGPDHWTVVVGMDTENIYVLCNGSRDVAVPISEIKNGYVNRLIIVTKKEIKE